MTTITVAEQAWQVIVGAASAIISHPNTMTPLAYLDEMGRVNLLHEIENRVAAITNQGGRHIFPDDDVCDIRWILNHSLGDLVPFVVAALDRSEVLRG